MKFVTSSEHAIITAGYHVEFTVFVDLRLFKYSTIHAFTHLSIFYLSYKLRRTAEVYLN